MLGKKQNTQLNLQNCWVTVFGIQKLTCKKRKDAEQGACEDKKRIATRAKALNLDAIHDTVHEMCKDEARHGKGFEGLYNRYFGDKK